MASKTFDDTPLTPYYSTVSPGVTTVALNATYGRMFYMVAPGDIAGIRFRNVIASANLRVGLWSSIGGSTELTAQRIDLTGLAAGEYIYKFPVKYPVTWSDIANQRATTQGFIVAIWDRDATSYMDNLVSSAYILPNSNVYQIGECYFNADAGGRRSGAASGWAIPTVSSINGGALDPYILPETSVDGYDPTFYPYAYGENNTSVTTASSDRTIGCSIIIKNAGSVLKGVRFYTDDPTSWVAQVKAWYPTSTIGTYVRLDTEAGIINCSGPGVYECFFKDDIVITDTHLRYTADRNTIIIGLYNLTDTTYTYSTTGYQVVPWAVPLSTHLFVHPERPSIYVSGDAMPTTTDATAVYPIAPLMSRT